MDYTNGTQGHEATDHGAHDQLPEVDALSNAALNESSIGSSSQRHRNDLQQRMYEQARTIRELTQQLQQTQVELHDSTKTQSELNILLQAAMSTPSTLPRPSETPGPHRLQPRAQRQEDREFQEKVRNQQNAAPGTPTNPPPQDPAALDFLKILAQTITQHNQNDLTEPAKFNGQDQLSEV